MDSLYSWSDTTKIGVALTVMGMIFFLLGVLLLLDRTLLTMGNILFVAGIGLVMGHVRFKKFFLKRLRASVCFFLGIALVLAGWCITGIIIQGFGALNLFGNFFPMIARVLESVPVIGPIIQSPSVQKILVKLNVCNHYSRNV